MFWIGYFVEFITLCFDCWKFLFVFNLIDCLKLSNFPRGAWTIQAVV